MANGRKGTKEVELRTLRHPPREHDARKRVPSEPDANSVLGPPILPPDPRREKTSTGVGRPGQEGRKGISAVRHGRMEGTSNTDATRVEEDEVEVVRVVLRPRRTVRWTEDTVDNEGLGRKKSKSCCVYHGPGHRARPCHEEHEEEQPDPEGVDDGCVGGCNHGSTR